MLNARGKDLGYMQKQKYLGLNPPAIIKKNIEDKENEKINYIIFID